MGLPTSATDAYVISGAACIAVFAKCAGPSLPSFRTPFSGVRNLLFNLPATILCAALRHTGIC